MWRKLLLLAVLAAGTISLTSCNLGDSSCTAPSRTQTGSGSGSGSRTSASVCGSGQNDSSGSEYQPIGFDCNNQAGFKRFLYMAAAPDLTGEYIYTFGLDDAGNATYMCRSARANGAMAIAAVDNKYLYAYSGESAKLYAFSLNGPIVQALSTYDVGTAWPDLAELAGDFFYTRWAIVNDTAGYLYIGNFDPLAGITTAKVSTGGVALVPGSPFKDGNAHTRLAVNPAGTFLYSLRPYGGTTVDQFSVTQGVLTALAPPSVFAAGTNPIAAKVDTQHNFLFELNSDSVSTYRIDPSSGTLSFASDTPLPQSPYVPFDFEIDPLGRFLYVSRSETSAGELRAFAIDPLTGVLTPVPGEPFLADQKGVGSLRIDPEGRYLWAVVGQTGHTTVLGLAINQQTGALTPGTGTPPEFGLSYNSPIVVVVPK